MKIKDLAVGQEVRVTGYAAAERAYLQKLLRMGLVKGTEFSVVRSAPLGDPVEIRLHGYSLTLRKSEAEALDVEPVRGPT